MPRTLRTGLIQPSTREFTRESRRIPGYSLVDWLHGYVYMRWPYLYIGIATGEHPLSRVGAAIIGALARVFPALRGGPTREGQITWADTYHGKVVPLDAAKQLVTVNQDIRLTDLERVIPYARARDIIMHNPDRIVLLDCPCRSGRPNPCLPLDVCLIVGDPFASFVAEHHPDRSRWITQEEAVEVLRAEQARGHVSHAFFKDVILGRFYAICNCCSCCCGAMQAHQNNTPMLASSGYISEVDEARCAGCGTCAQFCQFEAIAVHDGHAVVDVDACMGCGVCVAKCEHDAVALVRDPSKGEPLEIEVLLAQAAEGV